MTLDEANLKLDKIVEKKHDTVYLQAERDRFGKPIVVRLDGLFTPDELQEIALIAIEIDR